MFDLLLIFVVVFLVNIIPAFMPPTWFVLAFFSAAYGTGVIELVLVGVFASTAGRYVLAKISGQATEHFLPRKQKSSVKYLKNFLAGEPWPMLSGITFVYSLSPLPSNVIFIVAGAARLPLLPVLGGFFAGRLISYSILTSLVVGVVSINQLLSPEYLAVDMIGLAAAVALLLVDWRRLIKHTIENEKRRRAEEGIRNVFKER